LSFKILRDSRCSGGCACHAEGLRGDRRRVSLSKAFSEFTRRGEWRVAAKTFGVQSLERSQFPKSS